MKDKAHQNAQQIVRSGYDQIAEAYASQRDRFDHWAELTAFCDTLRPGAEVLDAGCGAGVPVARHLCEQGFDVVGIDFSESMIRLARRNVPDASFLLMDMLNTGFPAQSFHGITAFYSAIHIERSLHSKLFAEFHRLLRPGGAMLVTCGPDAWEDTDTYFGAPMYWSHWAPAKSLDLICRAGFEIVFDRTLTINEETHYWVLASRVG